MRTISRRRHCLSSLIASASSIEVSACRTGVRSTYCCAVSDAEGLRLMSLPSIPGFRAHDCATKSLHANTCSADARTTASAASSARNNLSRFA